MADDWYYAQGNQQLGPVTWEALQALARAGQLGAQTLVWMAGMPQWQPAGSVPGLMGNVPPPAYAPPQAYMGPGGGLNYFNPGVGQVPYAGFWLRFCAYVVDWLIVALPLAIVGRIFITQPTPVFMPGRPAVLPPGFFAGACGYPLIEMALFWLYFAAMESSSLQGTVGKMALGLKVTDIAGQPLTFGRAVGRNFGKFVSGLILGVGYMMAGWTERKQGLHDLMADTLVVRK